MKLCYETMLLCFHIMDYVINIYVIYKIIRNFMSSCWIMVYYRSINIAKIKKN